MTLEEAIQFHAVETELMKQHKAVNELILGSDGYEKALQEHTQTAEWLAELAERRKQPEIVHCGECVYYDPPHVEKDGVRYEYTDMPAEAFDELGTGLVTLEYGINVGGRCCRDYNVRYSEDKRVFVPENNYCGRAERN